MKTKFVMGNMSGRFFLLGMLLCSASSGYGHGDYRGAPGAKRDFNVTTQGPFWPPSTVVDKDGNFVVVGTVLKKDKSGTVVPVPNQAALVSKNTVPPLDSNGVEDFTNFVSAPYDVIRYLDLGPRGRDRKIELFTPSFGPSKGSFGGGPRIPKEGESPYNLNMIPSPCPEIFPASSQEYNFTRGSYPLHQYPVLGFQGDQVAYDADTGAAYDPMTRSGPGCEAGCSGESMVDFARDEPITLGEWLKAKGDFKVQLTRYSGKAGGYTAAKFQLNFKRLLPNSVYTAWALKQRVFSQGRFPGPLGVPNVFTSDEFGNAEMTVELPNPFPDRNIDEEGLRLIGIEVSYHPDAQNWGACGEKHGVGYRIFNWFDMKPDGSRDFEHLVTVASSAH